MRELRGGRRGPRLLPFSARLGMAGQREEFQTRPRPGDTWRARAAKPPAAVGPRTTGYGQSRNGCGGGEATAPLGRRDGPGRDTAVARIAICQWGGADNRSDLSPYDRQVGGQRGVPGPAAVRLSLGRRWVFSGRLCPPGVRYLVAPWCSRNKYLRTCRRGC